MTTTTAPVVAKLDLTDIQPADIILTRSPSTQSYGIRMGSCSEFSHAILATYDGMCIEAIGKGVTRSALSDTLNHASYGVLYRHRFITSEEARWVCHYAKNQALAGKPYDYLGAARAGVSSGCGGFYLFTKPGLIIKLYDEYNKNSQHDESFFCSELVARAFEEAGIRLTDFSARATTPGAIAMSNKLEFIKEVVLT